MEGEACERAGSRLWRRLPLSPALSPEYVGEGDKRKPANQRCPREYVAEGVRQKTAGKGT